MQQQLTNYLKAGYPGLYILSHEERRVEQEFRAVAKAMNYKLWLWSFSHGTVELDLDNPETATAPDANTREPVKMLDGFTQLPERTILIARDFHAFLAGAHPNPLIVRKLKDALANAKSSNRFLVIVGCQLLLPPELEKELTVIEFKLPDRAQIKVVLDDIARVAGVTLNGQLEPLLDAASGLTTIEAENAFALAAVESGGSDISAAVVAREKANTVKKNGILEIVDTNLGLDDVGGGDERKQWLLKRRRAFSPEAKKYGLPTPKGELLVGIPGCGKSLNAKVTRNVLGVPLLKCDCGRLFASLVGESERNLRSVIATAEAIAPCVLWFDEIEKGMSGSQSSGRTDGGTAARVFGTFLQWLQEKTAPVYVYATANDISAMDPAFLRKGRWDEIWFVDLPNEEERQAIWQIQIAKHKRDPKDFDLQQLARLSENFTGSEIEALFTEALFAGFDEGKEPTDLDIARLSGNMVPLSKMMAGEIDTLRKWAVGRARPVTAPIARSGKRKLANN